MFVCVCVFSFQSPAQLSRSVQQSAAALRGVTHSFSQSSQLRNAVAAAALVSRPGKHAGLQGSKVRSSSASGRTSKTVTSTWRKRNSTTPGRFWAPRGSDRNPKSTPPLRLPRPPLFCPSLSRSSVSPSLLLATAALCCSRGSRLGWGGSAHLGFTLNHFEIDDGKEALCVE